MNNSMSILGNSYVISRVLKYLESYSNHETFNGTFSEINKLNELARSYGYLSFKQHTSENEIINEYIRLITELVGEDKHSIDIISFMIIPKILYSDLSDVDFIKTVLLYEAINMTVTYGYDMKTIEYIINSVIRK